MMKHREKHHNIPVEDDFRGMIDSSFENDQNSKLKAAVISDIDHGK